MFSNYGVILGERTPIDLVPTFYGRHLHVDQKPIVLLKIRELLRGLQLSEIDAGTAKRADVHPISGDNSRWLLRQSADP